MIKYLFSLLLLLFVTQSCSDYDFENEYDFRNYLRDLHPYSKVVKINDLRAYKWCYFVDDTINSEKIIFCLTFGKDNASLDSVILNNLK